MTVPRQSHKPVRVIVYIDGFNLYFGLKSKGWTRFLWLNLQNVAERLLKPYQTLVYTKYFTARVTMPRTLDGLLFVMPHALAIYPVFATRRLIQVPL
jgi:hypothetical protein